MDLVKCNSCHGVYRPIGDDGIRYFHACPPLSVSEVDALVAAGALKLTDAALEAVLEGRLQLPRPLARDENVPSTRARDAGQVKAEGTGVVAVVDAVATREDPL
jgi:hypothetical protein